MHDLAGPRTATGFAEVERGEGLLARLVAAVVGFPKSGKNVPVEVRFEGPSEALFCCRKRQTDFDRPRPAAREAVR